MGSLQNNYQSYDKHFPEKCMKFNKYSHKLSKWTMLDILKLIKYRDKLYKWFKMYSSENGEYKLLKHNLKI